MRRRRSSKATYWPAGKNTSSSLNCIDIKFFNCFSNVLTSVLALLALFWQMRRRRISWKATYWPAGLQPQVKTESHGINSTSWTSRSSWQVWRIFCSIIIDIRNVFATFSIMVTHHNFQFLWQNRKITRIFLPSCQGPLVAYYHTCSRVAISS